ncbi:MAG: hypothetical protein OXC48_07935 [Endozoicomonadaceae bacterium]|nr:hypothetical protein [Endozoicomonadaceae bacterium]
MITRDIIVLTEMQGHNAVFLKWHYDYSVPFLENQRYIASINHSF